MISNPAKVRPITRAREVIRERHLEAPDEIDIEALAFFYDAAVEYRALTGMDGSIVRDGNRAIITVREDISYEGQKRFVIAHELGHFFLHPTARQVETVDAKQTSNWSDRVALEEREANYFAAELLIPSQMMMPMLNGQEPGFELIDTLRNEFKTTLTSTAVQFIENTTEECALIASSNRQRDWFMCSRGFSFKMSSDQRIHGHSCAGELGPNNSKSKSSRIEADCWLEGFRGQSKAYITEDSRYFRGLQKTLTLLWIHDAI